MRLSKRAEQHAPQTLIETFVDAGPLITLLSSNDHQIMYGRRGTGKTHALQYVANEVTEKGNCAIYVDLRSIGSSVGVYSDQGLPLAERATRLLVDVMLAFHDGLTDFALTDAEELELQRVSPILDELADGVTEVKVVGRVEDSESETVRGESSRGSRNSLDITAGSSPSMSASFSTENVDSISGERAISRSKSGVEIHYVQFGRVGSALKKLADIWSPRQLWLLLDEWSSVPFELQPYLADLIRRSILPVTGVVVKIAAIEGRVNLRLIGEESDYVGIEVGADMTANVNLDDFMVFDNDSIRAKEFFQNFLFRHLRSVDGGAALAGISAPAELIRQAFTQVTAFEEFVTASEGVPRDAMNILSAAATKAGSDSISVDDIRIGARQWYQRDKHTAVAAHSEAERLLHWIIDEVIKHRRARAFLLNSSIRDNLIERLYDERVLHILKRSISSHDDPGVRYNVYKLDYGCYVDLLTTQQAPQGLLQLDESLEEGKYIEVPPDDYRSIRRAILRLEEFRESNPV